MKILQATVDDAEEILLLQKLAYQSEAELYGNYDIPPLKQTVDELREQFKDHVILKAVLDDKIIGTVRAHEENGTCHIGRLAVQPEYQNNGVGKALMKVIESYFAPQRFELFTGSKSEKNIHLYKKLGYTIYKTGKHGCSDIEVFYMERYKDNGGLMNIEKRDFDKEAASWDEHPSRVKLANDVANAIAKHIALTSDMDVLDFGCGTGLLTLQLQPLVHSITGADSSEGMLAVFKKKIANRNLTNVKALLLDLDKDDTLEGNYHLIVSNMTLHHIRETKPLLDQFYKVTVPAGYLCVTDLDPDNGQFHDDNTGVFHFGFDRAALRKAFMDAGFDNVQDTTAAEIVKPAPNGEMRRFTVFLICAQKR